MITVRFTYLTGIKRRIFGRPRLSGSWDGWTDRPMTEIVAEDGCPAFTASVDFPDADAGRTFSWGVRLDGNVPNAWAINMEVQDPASPDRHAEVTLPAAGGTADARYYFTTSRRLGAQKRFLPGRAAPALEFAVWAPNARRVDVVFGTLDRGYIADDGTGVDPAMPSIPLERGEEGIWESGPVGDFDRFCGLPYMFRIENAQGRTVYRTDIYSRWQIGRGNRNPARDAWNGRPQTLDGTVSCSVIIDLDVVRREFEAEQPEPIPDDEFWASEFTSGRPVPTAFDDLIIYELHVGSLGYPSQGPGTLADACALLDYLQDLGINAIELLPVSEFSGNLSWGYGDTHHFVIESSAGGRDKYKHFVRECHRRGIAVIQDVVYNHYDQNAERAEWAYDSTAPEENIYYWYEGRPSDYAAPEHGYLRNGSSGFTPRFRERLVRQMFISSAVEFVEAFHVDGLRVDLTQAIHRDNALNMDGGRGVPAANLFGQKLLREWSRTLKAVRPTAFLIAEDHTGWDAVTRTPHVGGLGFDATWFAEFYHHLIGDSDMSGGAARLLHDAGFGFDGPLAVDAFADRLWRSQFRHVVYHESHDEAGNASGSMRTARVAVNGAALVGATRTWAEARSRVVAGLSLLSAGTPMFFMGEEIVAQKPAKYDTLATSKEDLLGERAGDGRRMFRFYQDVIRLRRANPAVTSRRIDIVHALPATRVLAFTRRDRGNDLLIAVSLNNHPFEQGYVIQTTPDRLPDGPWRETFNSDSAIYGGNDVGNAGAAVPGVLGRIELRLPAAGFIVLQRA
jgi:1,4-alpha-glucan branching enzyme